MTTTERNGLLIAVAVLVAITYWDRWTNIASIKTPLNVERLPNTLLDNLLRNNRDGT